MSLITLTGLLGMALMTLSYACKNDDTLRVINIGGILVWMSHFALLEAWSVTIMLFVGLLILGSSLLAFSTIAKLLIALVGIGIPVSIITWLAGYTTLDLALAMVITFSLNAGIVLLSGHALSLSVGFALALNIVLSLMVGSLFGALTNAANLGGLTWRTFTLFREDKARQGICT